MKKHILVLTLLIFVSISLYASQTKRTDNTDVLLNSATDTTVVQTRGCTKYTAQVTTTSTALSQQDLILLAKIALSNSDTMQNGDRFEIQRKQHNTHKGEGFQISIETFRVGPAYQEFLKALREHAEKSTGEYDVTLTIQKARDLRLLLNCCF